MSKVIRNNKFQEKDFRMKLYSYVAINHFTFHHFSTVVDFSSDTRTPSASREIYKPSALAIKLINSKAVAGKELSLSS